MKDKIAIQILGKEFLINCPADAQQQLLTSAQQLNERMSAIKTGGTYGLDRVAVLAALNLTHELLQSQQQLEQLQQQQQQLNDRINRFLDGRGTANKITE